MNNTTKKKATIVEIATALNVGNRAVRYWLSGERVPRLTVTQTQALCKLLDCSVFDLPSDFNRIVRV